MSILIKGINLPKEGEHIIALIKTNGKVSYFEQDIETTTCKIMKDTEAIQIPTPHGRLIDRSVLLEEYQNLCNGLLCRDCPFFNERNSCNIEEWILNQPPILEAEE